MRPHRIGIDLGGTKTESVLLDPEGVQLLRRRVATERALGYRGIVEMVAELVRDTLAHVPAAHASTVGVDIPGMWDSKRGVVLGANTTELIGQPLRDDLQAALGRRISLQNDANCFALAEALAGAATGNSCVFGVIMGTGCGGGLVLDGVVREGAHGIAGEWGHFSIDPQGRSCYCGNKGCIETSISGGGLEQTYAEVSGAAQGDPIRVRAAEIVERARAGEEAAATVFDGFLESFGRALGGLISIIDPDIVVLGGGLSNIDELYGEGIVRVRRYAFHPELSTPIVRNALGDSAGVIGAAWNGI